jgi:phosphonate transport system substrate-binding protein
VHQPRSAARPMRVVDRGRPPAIRFTSCQAPAAEAFGAAVARYVGERLGIPVEFEDRLPWRERLRAFDAGRIHVCWMCGLPYVWRSDRGDAGLELLAAPVMEGPRYRDRPVYFSDVVVRSDTRCRSFAELEGAAWAYNEETSHSGYNATRHRLARMGRTRGFFGKVVVAGSHEAALRLLLAGRVDGCAIDSTVLDLLRGRDSSLAGRLRTIDTFGPSAMPPWVVSRVVPRPLRRALREALLTMSGDLSGREALAAGKAARFASVTDRDYDPIRRMAREAERVAL